MQHDDVSMILCHLLIYFLDKRFSCLKPLRSVPAALLIDVFGPRDIIPTQAYESQEKEPGLDNHRPGALPVIRISDVFFLQIAMV